jgi:hypothetical protein
MKVFIIKSARFIIIILSLVFLTDTIGFFNPDYNLQDGLVKKRWDYFYHYTEKINFDILLIGNSHLYQGIQPKYLCNILGVNAFMLTAPGTFIIDNYFTLNEALTRTKPKLVIIETFTIPVPGKKTHDLTGEMLSNIFKSFNARKNFIIKLLSTPFLFTIDDYPIAWSNSIRNHEFIFDNFKQIETNIDILKKSSNKEKSSFYPLCLGESNVSKIGLKEDVLMRYDKQGAPVDYSKTFISDESVFYLKKIKKLCEDNNIQLMFLTIPMYYRNIKKYNIWKNVFTEKLFEISKYWLNLQEQFNYKGFTEASFENTYDINQHMTYQGSITATYKLAEFIQKNYPNLFPDRKKDSVWIKMFYGEDGYFENNTPLIIKDTNNLILLKDVQFENIYVLEADLLRKNRNFSLLLKISKNNLNEEILKKSQLIVTAEVIVTKTIRNIDIRIPYDELRTPENYGIFQTKIEPLKITKIKNVKLFILN